MAGPQLSRDAFGDTSATKVPAPAELDAALTEARKRGRALLVLVVPAAVDERLLRGHAWGSFLMYASPAELNLLAAVDVVCAPMKDLTAPGITGEPWAIYFDAKAAHAVDAKIPAVTAVGRGGQAAATKSATASIDRQIAAIGAMLQKALPPSVVSTAPDPATVRRLREDAPAGSRWDKVWDCPPCGMSFTPPKSERFLTFFVKGELPPPKPFGE